MVEVFSAFESAAQKETIWLDHSWKVHSLVQELYPILRIIRLNHDQNLTPLGSLAADESENFRYKSQHLAKRVILRLLGLQPILNPIWPPTIYIHMAAYYPDRLSQGLQNGEVKQDEIERWTGLTETDFLANPLIFPVFIHLHELGHAYDFLANFCQGNTDPEFLNQQVSRYRQAALRQLQTLPVPGVRPSVLLKKIQSGDFAAEFQQHALQFLAKGYTDIWQLLEAQREAYLQFPEEQAANSFAGRLIVQHGKELTTL